ncbi:kinesin-like protein KIN-7K, chloroplastic [Ipomoea triloba]|uniref:kinesin-like protein KIN-7K, chloroplastic n=1 Tax=Ipomoea triloba TaxID=35885 RepID=UPI00125DCF7B|nr:kinesin-like protein KIN-7K, chloroplastic [Ipomoea triloba]
MLLHHEPPPPPTPPLIASSFLPIRRHHRRCTATASPTKTPTLPPLFLRRRQRCQTPGREFLLRVSYLEIYNEVINDLLDPTGQNLRVREDAQGTYVEGIKEEVVLSPGHALSFIAAGEDHRHVGSNNFNLFSSRSHTIFSLMIESSAHRDDYDGVIFSQLVWFI